MHRIKKEEPNKLPVPMSEPLPTMAHRYRSVLRPQPRRRLKLEAEETALRAAISAAVARDRGHQYADKLATNTSCVNVALLIVFVLAS